jgi:amino-acid N-acetyltransferase
MAEVSAGRRAADAGIVRARPRDLEPVLALLGQASLPGAGVAEHFENFLVAREDERIVGAVGWERDGQSALLRSLVVAPAHRRWGLGQALTERLLEEARAQGVRRVFLLTETAAGFFPRFGFKPLRRDEADPTVRRSVEFTTACPDSAVCLRLDL